MSGFVFRRNRFVDVEVALSTGVEEGVRNAGEHLLGVSRALAPIEEGTLAGSGTVTVASTPVRGSRAAVSYSTPYAVVQHEDLTFRHDAGRQAKYLEQPMATERSTMRRLIHQAVRARFGRIR